MVRIENLQRYAQFGNQYKDALIIHPIMTGGLVSKEVQQRIVEEGWTRIGVTTVPTIIINNRRKIVGAP